MPILDFRYCLRAINCFQRSRRGTRNPSIPTTCPSTTTIHTRIHMIPASTHIRLPLSITTHRLQEFYSHQPKSMPIDVSAGGIKSGTVPFGRNVMESPANVDTLGTLKRHPGTIATDPMTHVICRNTSDRDLTQIHPRLVVTRPRTNIGDRSMTGLLWSLPHLGTLHTGTGTETGIEKGTGTEIPQLLTAGIPSRLSVWNDVWQESNWANLATIALGMVMPLRIMNVRMLLREWKMEVRH